MEGRDQSDFLMGWVLYVSLASWVCDEPAHHQRDLHNLCQQVSQKVFY
jgi:hypothetical protein